MEIVDKEIYWAFIKLVVSLPLVLLLAYVLLRYLPGRKKVNFDGKRRMRLLEQLWLCPKTAICLVEVGGVFFLIAKQEGSLSLLKELDGLPPLLEAEENDRPPAFGLEPARSLLNRSKDNRSPFASAVSKWPAPLSLLNMHFIKHNRGKRDQ